MYLKLHYYDEKGLKNELIKKFHKKNSLGEFLLPRLFYGIFRSLESTDFQNHALLIFGFSL